MKTVILFGFLLALLGYLEAEHAQSDPEFTAKARQMLAVFGNSEVDRYTKSRNLPALIEFYEKYSSRLPLTVQDRTYANNVIRRYRAHNNQQVDGVPAQGGVGVVFALLLPFAVSIVEGIAKAIRE
uniref:Protein Turandot F n=2 Tax=Drosophila melanogaster TaxID=7227 RepID=TOTF_DROME|nr:turandot F [Drosophila melanogaster]Q9VIR2.3 RecName: Full=Protein Turandot F; Flags: Precursor [Drosophila melanogaster]AAF53853.3 turandot F [Drosophila melanogaster]ADE06701.1 RT06928p1 [Drosophila melanogaster]AOQ11367.1 TotF-RA [synthetic construct]|eukprot:NP_536780.3 turandot F [Drosophila melanogaster]